MFMKLINMHEAKTNLSRLVEEAANGEEIIIAKAGKPKVKLSPLEKRKKLIPGLLKGKIKIIGDFDEPLPKDILNKFYGL